MSQSPFQKFSGKKKNSVIKEEMRQKKKKYRKERNEYFENKKKEEFLVRQAKKAGMAPKATITVKNKLAENDKPQKIAATSFQKQSKTGTKKSNVVIGKMPLNKYLAHCGVCSRRDAVELINAGKVKINGKPATEPGYKVEEKDEVVFNGKKLFVTKNLVYILLNKPKDYITTTDDPQGRKTVLQLIKQATSERVYPIGRLDRNTSGVLLLTNDGDLTQKLSHPSYEIKKIYEVRLDKPLTKKRFR